MKWKQCSDPSAAAAFSAFFGQIEVGLDEEDLVIVFKRPRHFLPSAGRCPRCRLVELDALHKEHPFSLRQLLGHTSGLPDYGSLKEYHSAVARGDAPWSREKLLEATLAQGMHFPPGEGWSYSNIDYLFVRELIEVATGKPLGDVIQNLIVWNFV